MSRSSKVLGLVSLAVGLACGGCSSGSGGAATSGNGSCTSTGAGGMSCTDYGSGFDACLVMQICSGMSESYSAEPCPSANRIGRCEITETRDGVTVGDAVSVYPPETASSAMSICSMENGVNGAVTMWVAN